jgi:hypothetical protein
MEQALIKWTVGHGYQTAMPAEARILARIQVLFPKETAQEPVSKATFRKQWSVHKVSSECSKSRACTAIGLESIETDTEDHCRWASTGVMIHDRV